MQCNSIHKTIVDDFRQAVVYGKSVKHQPQRVGLSHELADEDIRKFELAFYRGSTTHNITSHHYQTVEGLMRPVS
jgi:hypothetical protein